MQDAKILSFEEMQAENWNIFALYKEFTYIENQVKWLQKEDYF